jgi:hypothetical protein
VNNIQQMETTPEPTTIHPSIQAVLQEFDDIFYESMTLPPQRECDHSIPLKEGSKPPNIRPYRVSFKQKDEVEKLIKALVQDAIIRPSTHPLPFWSRRRMDHRDYASTIESSTHKQYSTEQISNTND